MPGGVFVGVEKHLIGGITDATKGLMMSYSSMMMGLAAASATIYIMWRGYQTLAGKLSTPMEDTMWDIMRMAIILSFVANLGGYLDGVIDAVNGLKEGFSGSDNIWQLLDSLWNNAKALGKTLHDMDNSTYIKDEGMTAQFYVWLGIFVLMIITAFVSMVAEIMILLLGITAPIFIFCLMYGFLRPMFNNWLQNIFAAILTILLSSLSLRIVVNYLNSRLALATQGAAQANIVELGAQVCLAGICAAILVYISAKLAAALAGASATVSMQGMAAMGLGVAAYGAGKLAGGAARETKRSLQDNIQGWKDANAGKPGKPGGGLGYNAAKARKYAIEQMIARNEARNLAKSRESAVQKFNAPQPKPSVTWTTQPPVNPNPKQPKP
ncbi:type IV secretion system protein [Salmonella enterica]|nr:type IV secretion system protein [Salmonella enterica]EAX8328957.1 type IV secretion system protein [Salmonella enterica]EIS6182942.1 type IV secretion system protein [Salmonella enterica]EJW7250403.1 type IV secretion system protein [Salmonella enterica]EKA6293948.1 type IV secretion system protein [Salmonella enterica]QGH05299.1 conjugal transfer protein TrbL [Salmonella enterica subsp. enterica serovar Muenchen]